MKKIYIMIAIAASLAACTEKHEYENIENGRKEVITFGAGFEGQEASKTSLTSSMTVKWNADDKVMIYSGADGVEGTIAIKADTEDMTGTFTVSVNPATTYYAVYPSSAADGNASGTLTVNVPVAQAAQAGSFGIGANVSVAQTTSLDKNFTFKNVGGLYAFNVPFDNVTEVTLTANDGVIAGKATVTFNSEGTPVVTPVEGETAASVTVSGDFVKGQMYFASILAGDYAGGIAVTYKVGEENVTLNLHNAAPLVRSKARKFTMPETLTPSALAASAFVAGDNALVSDYDANVFAYNQPMAKNTELAAEGTSLLSLPFDAARVVVDRNTNSVDVYDETNDLQVLTVQFKYATTSAWVLEKVFVSGKWYFRTNSGWDSWKANKSYDFTASAADPQIMVWTGSLGMADHSDRQKLCFKVAGQKLSQNDLTVIAEGATDAPNPNTDNEANYNARVLAISPVTDASLVEYDTWMPAKLQVTNHQWWFYEETAAKVTLDNIVIDLRNLQVKISKVD